jgi:2-polyprenyl-3-methyl-5-hydroxy-6-metoxy-1,4-benzoquinol methylase
MTDLADKEFWERRHEGFVNEAVRRGSGTRGVLRRWLDGARAGVGAEPLQSYPDFLVDRLFVRHLPAHTDWTVIEVGCAPGDQLIRVNRRLGFQPYGVEYSPVGAATARKTFTDNGFDPSHVIEADFFSPSFHDQNRGRYDVVLSRGFIEHFDDPKTVIAAHVDLLRPGGFLVCSIPNLRSFAYPFLRVFGRDVLDAHNLGIMRLNTYRALFQDLDLATRFCGYVGVFQLFGVALRRERSLRGLIARGVDRFGDVMDHLSFLLLRGRAPETRWSPNLVYIGQTGER